jgi:hypothetical protein
MLARYGVDLAAIAILLVGERQERTHLLDREPQISAPLNEAEPF